MTVIKYNEIFLKRVALRWL